MRKYLLMLGASIALAIPLAAVTDAAARDYRINSWKNDPSCAEAKEKLAKGELMTAVACKPAGVDACFIPCTTTTGGAYRRLASGWRGCGELLASDCISLLCTKMVYDESSCGPRTLLEQYNETGYRCSQPTTGSGGAGE